MFIYITIVRFLFIYFRGCRWGSTFYLVWYHLRVLLLDDGYGFF